MALIFTERLASSERPKHGVFGCFGPMLGRTRLGVAQVAVDGGPGDAEGVGDLLDGVAAGVVCENDADDSARHT